MLAVTLTSWEEVNGYFEQGWVYVDSKIIEIGKKQWAYYFILKKKEENKPTLVTINRQRK